MTDNQLRNYWTSSGPYDELFYYIRHNIEDVRDDLILMISGEGIPIAIGQFYLCYLSACKKCRIEREDRAGKEFADFVFYPEQKNEDCIILELKVDSTPEEAIAQIKEKDYAFRACGRRD